MTTVRNFVIATAGYLLLYALMVILTINAKAGDWRRDAFGSGNYITGYASDLPNRRQAYRRSTVTHIPVTRYKRVRVVPEHYEAVHRRHRHRRVYVPVFEPRCHRVVSAIGSAGQNEDNAKARALLAWQADVSFRFGDRYLDITQARNAAYSCSQAGVPDTLGAKFQEAVGISHYRCMIVARPCRSELQRLDVKD